MLDPFRLEGPAVVSFSGGRTSAYMLWRILNAFEQELPEDVLVIFANTGKEMPETLDFVQMCADRWRVPIRWVEYRDDDDPQQRWQEVTFETASRNGEPYEALIKRKGYLPNPTMRFCTTELKIRPTRLFCQQSLDWDQWTMALGLRADEPRRVAKLSTPVPEVFDRVAPLAQAGIAVGDVGEFWAKQPFDLRLPNMNGKTMHGNCDLCFLKGAEQILSLVREQPKRAIWWMAQEAAVEAGGKSTGDAARFRKDRPSYAEYHRMATQHGELFEFADEPLQDCQCVE